MLHLRAPPHHLLQAKLDVVILARLSSTFDLDEKGGRVFLKVRMSVDSLIVARWDFPEFVHVEKSDEGGVIVVFKKVNQHFVSKQLRLANAKSESVLTPSKNICVAAFLQYLVQSKQKFWDLLVHQFQQQSFFSSYLSYTQSARRSLRGSVILLSSCFISQSAFSWPIAFSIYYLWIFKISIGFLPTLRQPLLPSFYLCSTLKGSHRGFFESSQIMLHPKLNMSTAEGNSKKSIRLPVLIHSRTQGARYQGMVSQSPRCFRTGSARAPTFFSQTKIQAQLNAAQKLQDRSFPLLRDRLCKLILKKIIFLQKASIRLTTYSIRLSSPNISFSTSARYSLFSSMRNAVCPSLSFRFVKFKYLEEREWPRSSNLRSRRSCLNLNWRGRKGASLWRTVIQFLQRCQHSQLQILRHLSLKVYFQQTSPKTSFLTWVRLSCGIYRQQPSIYSRLAGLGRSLKLWLQDLLQKQELMVCTKFWPGLSYYCSSSSCQKYTNSPQFIKLMKLRKKRIQNNLSSHTSLPSFGNKILPIPKPFLQVSKQEPIQRVKQIKEQLLQLWSGVLKQRYRDMNKWRLFKIWKATDGLLDIDRFRLILQENNLKLNDEQSNAMFNKIGMSEQKISYFRFKQFVEGKRYTISNSNLRDRDLLYLKSKSKKLFSRSKENDISGRGQISLKTFYNILETVSLEERSLNLAPLIQKYIVDQQNINYMQFCKDLDSYFFDFDAQPILNLRESAVFNRSKIPSTLLHRHLQKGQLISRLLRNYFPQPQLLLSELLKSKSQVFEAKELERLLKQFLFAINQTNKQSSIESFINLFQYNKEGKTFTKDLLDFLYVDSQEEYLTKAAQPSAGPPLNSPVLSTSESKFELPTNCTPESLFKKLLKIDPDRTGCITYQKLLNYLKKTYDLDNESAQHLLSQIDEEKKGYIKFQDIGKFLCQTGPFYSKQVYNYVPNPITQHRTQLFFAKPRLKPPEIIDDKKKFGRFAYRPDAQSNVIVPKKESSLFLPEKDRLLSRSLLNLKDQLSRQQRKRRQALNIRSIHQQAQRYTQAIQRTIQILQEKQDENLRSRKNRLSLNEEFIRAR